MDRLREKRSQSDGEEQNTVDGRVRLKRELKNLPPWRLKTKMKLKMIHLKCVVTNVSLTEDCGNEFL